VVTDKLCWGILGVAMAIAAGLILYLNRGTTFFVDEIGFLYSSPQLDASYVLEPDNGHLVATTRLAFKAILETFGADYLPFRLLAVSTVLLSAGLFYALARRRIGALPALAPALVLLFLGSDAQHVVIPVGLTVMLSTAAGLGALLAIERGDRRGDIAACGLLVLSLATFSVGLAFAVGIAISVLIRLDRRQRAWIFLIPLALYAAWWVWAQEAAQTSGNQAQLSDVLLIPSYVVESVAAVTGALAGLSYDFAPGSPRVLELGWGHVLAVLAVVGLFLRIRRGNVPPSLWASLGIVLTYWVLGALVVSSLRPPGLTRYIYVGAVGVLLVATDAARPIRFSKGGLVLLFAVCGISVATNLALLRDGAASFRDEYSVRARATFAMFELARGRLDPEPTTAAVPEVLDDRARAEAHLATVDRYGSLAVPLSELERQPESVRQSADQLLARILGLKLRPSPARPVGECQRAHNAEPGGPVLLELPAGGAAITAPELASATLTLGRFGSPSVEVRSVSRGETAKLSIPTDSSPKPWVAVVRGADSVEMCALR
jgi:VanZ family protein